MTVAQLLITALITFGLVGISVFVISLYTEMVRLMGQVRRARARIDMLQYRLLDELPKLVKICEDELGGEQCVLEALRAARCELEEATSSRARADGEAHLTRALETLFAAAESNAVLQARPSFERLQHRLSDIENQIEECRSLHDEVATVFNARIQGALEGLVARTLSLRRLSLLGGHEDAAADDTAESRMIA